MAVDSRWLEAERPQTLVTLYDCCVGSHVWVSLGVTALAAFVMWQHGVTADATPLAIVFFSTMLIYNLDTSRDLAKAHTARETWRARCATTLSWASLGALITTLAPCSWPTIGVVLAGAGISCLYAVPLGPRRLRVKALPGMKSLVVGVAVATAVVAVPLLSQGITPTPFTAFTFWLIVTLTTVNATLFDVRDYRQDRDRGLRTLPVVLGVHTTQRALAFVGGASFLGIAMLEPGLRDQALAACCVVIPLCFLLGPRSPRAAYAWLVDGFLLLPAALTYAF